MRTRIAAHNRTGHGWYVGGNLCPIGTQHSAARRGMAQCDVTARRGIETLHRAARHSARARRDKRGAARGARAARRGTARAHGTALR
eukprot:947163-Pyramimonas_sp.AAC.1